MNTCPHCNEKIKITKKIKLWYLLDVNCPHCSDKLKLDKKRLFSINISTIIVTLFLMYYMTTTSLPFIWLAVISLLFASVVPIPAVIYTVKYTK